MSDIPATAPCLPWPIDLTCVTLPPEATPELIDAKTLEATFLLWGASGRRIGPCPVVERPCLDSCADGGSSPYKGPDGLWRNRGCGCVGSCACTSLPRVWLPGPVADVLLVQVDGVEVPGDSWASTVEDGLVYLYRTDGGVWPSCSDPTAACDQPGSFCVTYLKGLPVDVVAVSAVSELTGELVRACIPNCPCRLPRNVQQMTRQGVSITFAPNQTWLRALPAVALFLDLRNPKGLTASPSIWSPDLPVSRQRRISFADQQIVVTGSLALETDVAAAGFGGIAILLAGSQAAETDAGLVGVAGVGLLVSGSQAAETDAGLVGVAGVFSPADFADLSGWFKADALALNDNDPVGTWADSSGAGRDMSQATAGNKPTFKTGIINGNPVVRFDGVNDQLDSVALISGFVTASAYTAFAVFNPTTVNTGGAVFGQDPVWTDTAAAYLGLSLDSTGLAEAFNYDGDYDAVSVDFTLGTPLIVMQRHESGNLYVSKNAGSESSVASGNTTALTGVLRVGRSYGATTNYYDGDLAELIFYSRALTPAEITSVHNYLSAKYGIS